MKANAAVLVKINEPFELREFEVTAPPAGYAKMDLIASGVCGTDVHMQTGRLGTKPPKIIGHEFIGRIAEVDAAEAAEYGLKKGDAVIVDIAMPCGKCPLCLSGDDANCVRMGLTNAATIDTPPYLFGGYSEVNYTPLTNLIKIPEELDPAMVATFACPGPTAIHAFELARRANIDVASMNVAVVQGLGPVGCFAIMYLHAIGVKHVYAINAVKDDARIALAKQLGAEEVFVLSEMGADEVSARLKQENDGLGVDLCFEASGSPKAVPQGIAILRNRGVYLVPGQYSNSGGIEIQPQLITFRALQIIGASQYSFCDVEKYLEFLMEHKELHKTIEALGTRYSLVDVNRAFDDIKGGRANIKTILVK